MSAITPERLRPMTDTERAAVELFEELTADGKPTEEVMKEISGLTGLPGPQIAAAVELKNKFGSLLEETAGIPKAGAVQIAAKPGPKPKSPSVATVKARPAVPSDTDALIAAAENSPQPRARELAAEIRRALAAVSQILRDDEKVRVLTASIDVMRRQLAADEAELHKLLGDTPAAQDSAPEPAMEAEAPAVPQVNGRDPLEYSQDVRFWAVREGWEVGASGRISGAIVAAYRKAHPEINGHRIDG